MASIVIGCRLRNRDEAGGLLQLSMDPFWRGLGPVGPATPSSPEQQYLLQEVTDVNTKSHWTLAFLALAVSTHLVGCGGGGGESTAPTVPATDSSSGTTDSEANAGSNTMAGGNAASATSGEMSSLTIVQDGVGTEPAQSVAVFLDSLRRGNEQAANGVLTTKAREELAKTAYVIQPLGTPEGQYKIGRVVFPYEEKSVSLVECQWTEPGVEGMPSVSMDIVCQVHQEPEGWRISGISVTLPGTEETLVLDFEDAAALQATIDAATGQASAGDAAPQQVAGQQQVAAQQVATQQMPNQQVPAQQVPYQTAPVQGAAGGQLPALPTYPPASGGTGAAAQSGSGQIAYPPQYDGGVIR